MSSTNSSTGVTQAYIVNVAKQYQINSNPLGTADLANTANFTTASQVQADWLQTDANAARYIRNKPVLATVATSGSASDLKTGVLPLTTIPQLPAPTISSGNFQIGSFAVDIIPTVDSQQSIGHPGASWQNVVTRNIAINKTSANTALDMVGQATITGSTIPQLTVVNPSSTADGTQPALVTFDCTAQGSGQLGAVGFGTTRGIFARIGGVDRLNISVAGNTSISGTLTGVNTGAHQLGNLLITDFGKSTSTVPFAGIGNATASTPTAGLLLPADGSVRINTASNAAVSFQNRYSTNLTIDSTGNVYPATTNAQYLGLTNLAWGTLNTANINCTQTMNYQGKPLQAIATSGSASDLITGVAPLPRIPNLPAGQITYGTYTVGAFGVEVDPTADFTYNLGNTTTRWKDVNCYSLDIKGYTTGGSNLGLHCAGPVTVTNGSSLIVHDQTAANNAGNATIEADVFQSYYDPSVHTFGTAFTGCTDGYATDTALWRHKSAGAVATSNAASNISTVYALKQNQYGMTTLNSASSQPLNLSIANANQVVLTNGVLRPANNAALDLGSTSYYYRNLYANNATISGNLTVAGSSNMTPPGVILQYGSSSAPSGFFACDGTAYSRTMYAALFAVVGTIYGSGDGYSTFNVPNFQGRVAVMQKGGDSYFSSMGASGGEETHYLSTAEMPGHSHSVTDPGHGHGVYDPGHSHHVPGAGRNFVAQGGNGTGQGLTNIGGPDVGGGQSNGSGCGIGIYGSGTGISVAAQGGSSAHNNLQPYLVVFYIIKN